MEQFYNSTTKCVEKIDTVPFLCKQLYICFTSRVTKYIPVHDLLYRTCSFSFSVFFFLFFSIIFLFPECGLLRRPLSAWASSPMSGSRPSIPRLASPGPTWHSSPSAPSSSARSTLSLSMTSMLELAWPSSSQVQYPLLVFLTVILLV